MPLSTPPPVATAASTTAELAIVRQINRVRRAHGLRGVRLDGRLERTARRHSVRMLRADALTHAPTLKARLSRTSPRSLYGEVLMWAPRGSQSSARTLVRLWLASAPHRHVLLDGRLRRVGVGRAYGRMGPTPGFAVTADFTS